MPNGTYGGVGGGANHPAYPIQEALVVGRSNTSFGHAMRAQWALDPAITYLNHGTVGATPRRVLASQLAIRDEMELQPSRFLLRDIIGLSGAQRPAMGRMRKAADPVAAFLGARTDDLVFVDNATAGVNAVLRSLEFRAGDEILVTDHGYGAVTYTAQYVARRAGATVRVVELPFPVRSPEQVADAVSAAIGPATKLLVMDHVASGSSLVMPLPEIARRCHARGVAVLADGAHAPGALDLDIASLGVDWYTGNLHKWAWAPRSCGILWAAPGRQAELHPPVISWGLDQGFTAEFDWVGTRDPSAWLASPEAIAMLRDLGAAKVRDYNHALALDAAALLVAELGAEPMGPESMIGTMVTLRLPERFGRVDADANCLRDLLLFEDSIEVQLHAWRDRIWVRISAQVYNERADIVRLVERLKARAPKG